jgi:hypothetical protein
MRRDFQVALVCLALVACTVDQTRTVPTKTFKPTETVVPTMELSTTIHPVATGTSTLIPTSPPTFSPEQYPSLKIAILTLADLSLDPPVSYFEEYFVGPSWYPPEKRNRPVIKDITSDLIGNGFCDLDCVGSLWSLEGLSVTISMFRAADAEVARLHSEKACFEIARKTKQHFEHYSDCQNYLTSSQHPTKDAWVLPSGKYHDTFGGTYGSIYLSIILYNRSPSDDYGVTIGMLIDAARLQIAKLEQTGFPGY